MTRHRQKVKISKRLTLEDCEDIKDYTLKCYSDFNNMKLFVERTK